MVQGRTVTAGHFSSKGNILADKVQSGADSSIFSLGSSGLQLRDYLILCSTEPAVLCVAFKFRYFDVKLTRSPVRMLFWILHSDCGKQRAHTVAECGFWHGCRLPPYSTYPQQTKGASEVLQHVL